MSAITPQDPQDTTVLEQCCHIAAQHEGLRLAFPRIEALLDAVVRAHAEAHPRLRDLQRAFREFRVELESHLDREEELLFPACTALERQGRPVEEALLAAHERDHVSVDHGLLALRVLAGDYDARQAACSTHGRLLDALAAFELDFHRRIDEENDILFARVRRMGLRGERERAPRGSRQPAAGGPDHRVLEDPRLPRCCEAWIGEQVRGWAPRHSLIQT